MCRKDFLAYLRRPDHKQEFVAQWQKDYNAVPDDMRDDEETRAELHQRVDDLREKLWNICDERKDQAENEREAIMTDGWLDDHMGILSNHYITLMQVSGLNHICRKIFFSPFGSLFVFSWISLPFELYFLIMTHCYSCLVYITVDLFVAGRNRQIPGYCSIAEGLL